MFYLIVEMLFFLAVTAVLGVIVGWLAKGLLAARNQRLQHETWRREIRRSEARAGNLKNQLAEAFLVEERLRQELNEFEATVPREGPEPDPEKVEALKAELARRDKKIETLKLQIKASEATLSSEWQSLKALKSQLAERQERVSGKLRSSEETRQQLRLQLRSMKRQGDQLRHELAASQKALADERLETAARIVELEAKLEEQETVVALLSADEAPAAEVEVPDAAEPAAAEPAAQEQAEELAEEPAGEEPPDKEPPDEEPPDDLQRIRGIGPVLHRKLNTAGVTSFRQIAAWTDDDIVEIAWQIGIGAGRVRKNGWVEAARELVS